MNKYLMRQLVKFAFRNTLYYKTMYAHRNKISLSYETWQADVIRLVT